MSARWRRAFSRIAAARLRGRAAFGAHSRRRDVSPKAAVRYPLSAVARAVFFVFFDISRISPKLVKKGAAGREVFEQTTKVACKLKKMVCKVPAWPSKKKGRGDSLFSKNLKRNKSKK